MGAMMKRLNERDKEKNRSTIETLRHRKEGNKNVQCMIMHEHVTCKTKKISWAKPNPT